MSEHEPPPPEFEEAIRAGLAAIVAAGPQPSDADLDALESRTAPPPARRTWTILAAVVAVLALLGTGAVLLRPEDGEQRVAVGVEPHACGSATTIEPNLRLPEPYRDEPRLVVPLGTDVGLGGPEGTPSAVPGEGTAELRYPNGDSIRFTTGAGSARDAAPSAFPTSRAEAEAEVQETLTTATSGMTASGAITTVESPVPLRRSFIESLARETAELPETIATAVAAERSFPPIEQSFTVGGHDVTRTVSFADGIVQVNTDLVSAGTGGVRGDGQPLSMMVGARRPEAVLEFEADGRYEWLLFVPNGLEVALDTAGGDRCTAALKDELTGGEYWMIQDRDGDEHANLQVTTQGAPDEMILSKYVG